MTPERAHEHQLSAADAAVQAVATSTATSIFLDPSGRRWRVLRRCALTLALLLVVGIAIALPRMYASPSLEGRPTPIQLSKAETGLRAPIVGEGPMERAVKLVRSPASAGHPATTRKVEPFTGADLGVLAPKDAAHAGDAPYAIEHYGYSAAAHKTIALTFDDGPSSPVTPQLLDVLGRAKVPATFFLVGQNVAAHPDVVARLSREGHAVGVHTMTHPDIAHLPDWEEQAELVATERTLRAITGRAATFWRMPYDGEDAEFQQDTIDGLLRAQRLGYTIASYDFDTKDWEHDANPTGKVTDIPLPDLRSGKNITMLLHDAGGPNRERTVEYVKRLIPVARAAGYTFQTMPQVQPSIRESNAPIEVTVWDKAVHAGAYAMYVLPNKLVEWLFALALFTVAVLGLGNVALASWRYRKRSRIVWPGADEIGLPVSVVLAAYNEEPVIARTLRSILASDYPVLEVVVVDDGSSDATAAQVRAVMAEDPRVVLLCQPNAGKAHALNNGVASARGDYVVTLDADTIMTPTTITNLMRHFALDTSGRLGAVAGVVRVGNRTTNLLTRWQALEYLTQIGIERSAQDQLGAISIIPGACAAWSKAAISAAGGYSNITLAEDCDLALMMHQLGWRVTQDDEALAYTEAPETVDDLIAQRTRWTFGTLQAIYKHRNLIFSRHAGALGWYVLPSYVFSVLFPIVFLPFTFVMACLAYQQQGPGVLVTFFLLFVALHVLIAAVGVKLMGEGFHHLLMVPIYRLVFEPLRAYLLYTSVWLAFKGVRMGWNKFARTGSLDTSAASTLEPTLAGSKS